MATAQTVINRCLRLCKVIDGDGVASASEALDALDVLNAMLAEWHEAGIGLPNYSFTGLTDATALDAGDAEAIAHQLAVRISGEYGAELSQLTLETAMATMARLRLRYFQPGTVSLAELPSAQQGFNIVTGDY